MRHRLAAALVTTAFLAGTGVFPQTEAEQGYRFKTDVMLIPVPVFVTDAKGEPVTGLTKEDFVLKEDGKPQPIVFFEPVSYDTLADEPPRRRMGPLIPGVQRQFLMLFDLTFTSPRGILRAQDAAMKFVADQLQPTDLVAVATYSNLAGLRFLANFTTDRVPAKHAIEGLGLVKSTDVIQDPVGFVFDTLLERETGQGSIPGEIEGNQEQLRDNLQALYDRSQASEEEAYRNYVNSYFTQFTQLATALNTMSGRKYILLLSEGVKSQFLTGTGITQMDDDLEKFLRNRPEAISATNRYGRSELRDVLLEALERASAADVVVHALDVSGLGGEAGDVPGKGAGGGQDSLYLMANETGGKLFKNVNDLRKPLASILRETRSYYLLGFQPGDVLSRGRFRKIEVEVKRPNVEVSARRGFYEPKSADKLTDVEKKLQVVEYVTKDILSDDVYFDTLTGAFPGERALVRLPVFMKFPGGQFLRAKRRSDVLEVEIYGYAIDAKGKFLDFFNKTLAFDLKRDRARLEKAGFKYYDLLLARPGDVRIKLIARDKETGAIGSVIEDVEVPDFAAGDFFVTPPVFVANEPDWIVARGIDPANPEPRRKGLPIAYPFHAEGQDFLPAIRPTLRASEPANVLVRVFNLKTEPATGAPQTEIKFEWVGPEGATQTLRRVGLVKKPQVSGGNCFELFLQAQWDGVPRGPALFQMSLTDLLAQKTGRSSSAFVLSGQ